MKVYEGTEVSDAWRSLGSGSKSSDDLSPEAVDPSPEPKTSDRSANTTASKRKLSVLFENEDDTYSEVLPHPRDREEVPAFYVSSKKKGGAKSKPETTTKEPDTKTEMMKDFTESFSTYVKKKTSTEDARNPSDYIDMWAKMLAGGVREVDSKIRRRFMHHIDGLVLEAIEGDWVP